MKSFSVEGIPYTVKRSRRRTIALHVSASGAVSVRAPRWMLSPFVHRFVRERRDWVRRTVERVRTRAAQAVAEWRDGGRVPVWGEPLRLAIEKAPGRTASWRVDAGRLLLEVPEQRSPMAALRRTVEAAYRQAVEARVADLVPPMAARLGVSAGRISVGVAESRWGSCTARGHLRFNARLAMMPPAMLEYVVAHEVAHLREMNHSRRFWDLVGQLLPEFKERQRWMKEHAPAYRLD